jgi:hypothetical protein
MCTELHRNERLRGSLYDSADTTGCELHYAMAAAWW